MDWIDTIDFDPRGLVPVVTQDALSGEILMQAFASRAALESTIRTGEAHYWSRSREEIWRKGATSGHVQRITEIRADCDRDSILYRVIQTGPACHTGERSCFHLLAGPAGLHPAETGTGDVLSRVSEVVAARKRALPDGSYTTYLFRNGLDKILKKVGEETTEVVIAAKNADGAEIAAEAADLLYHLLVMLQESGVELSHVRAELGQRFGQSSGPPSGRRDAELADHSTATQPDSDA